MNKLVAFILLVSITGAVSCKKKKSNVVNPTTHTVTLQPGSEGQDTYVSKIDNNASDGNNNLNFSNEIVMGRWTAAAGGLASFRSYIKFTGLSAIPANATVTTAKLYLYGKSSSVTFPNGNSSYPGSANAENSSLVKRVVGGDWNQTTLTWNTKPGTTDVGQATITASNLQWNYNTVVDVTDMVKEMIAHPSTNYGFCIQLANESPYRSLIFATSEATDPSSRPKLVVDATY